MFFAFLLFWSFFKVATVLLEQISLLVCVQLKKRPVSRDVCTVWVHEMCMCESFLNSKKCCFLVWLNVFVYSYFQPSCLTLSTLFGFTSVRPKADYYPFFALMLRWEWLNLFWPGTVCLGLTCQSPQEETPQLPLLLLLPPVLSSCQVKLLQGQMSLCMHG